MTQPLQTQYLCLNDRRLHYGSLFWQNIAFHIAGLLGVAALLGWVRPSTVVLGLMVIGAGLATGLMAFIAYRLQRLEGQYEQHLRAIEDHWIAAGETGIQRPAVSGRLGSRLIVVIALAVAGMALIPLGVALAAGGLPR